MTKKATGSIATALGLSLGLMGSVSPTASGEGPELVDLSSVDELAAAFNADRGKPRIVLLLSPT